MAEAIISRRGYGPEGHQSYVLLTNVIISNGIFQVPEAKDQSFDVRIFGGGGGGSTYGGGGGWMNNDTLILNYGMAIPISIGECG